MATDCQVTRWPHAAPPTRDQIESAFRDLELSGGWWSSSAGDIFSPHSHSYEKVLFCADGSIHFDIAPQGESVAMTAGDRIVIPARTVHSAIVGPLGVTCAEASRPG